MPRRSTSVGQRLAEVDRLAEQVEDAPERHLADRDRDRPAGVDHLGAAGEPVGGVHRDRAHAVVAEVLLDLAHEHAPRRRSALMPPAPPPRPRPRAGRRDRVVDLGQALGEDGLDHDALDLLDAPDVALLGGCARSAAVGRSDWVAVEASIVLCVSCLSVGRRCGGSVGSGATQLRPSAPATTSMISWVISAWRARFICSV